MATLVTQSATRVTIVTQSATRVAIVTQSATRVAIVTQSATRVAIVAQSATIVTIVLQSVTIVTIVPQSSLEDVVLQPVTIVTIVLQSVTIVTIVLQSVTIVTIVPQSSLEDVVLQPVTIVTIVPQSSLEDIVSQSLGGHRLSRTHRVHSRHVVYDARSVCTCHPLLALLLCSARSGLLPPSLEGCFIQCFISHQRRESMPRSIWKLPFSEIPLPLPPARSETMQDQRTKIWSRRSTVLPHFVGRNFLVHNGKVFIPLKVSEDMIGHKFGEFATTRKRPSHKINKKRQSRKK